MLKTLTMSIVAGALVLPAMADCAGEEAAIRAKAAEVAEMSTKVEAHRALVQTASAGVEKAATPEEKTTFEDQLGTYETELDDLKAARGSLLYDVLDLTMTYQKACKAPAQPLLDELGIKAEDLPEY